MNQNINFIYKEAFLNDTNIKSTFGKYHQTFKKIPWRSNSDGNQGFFLKTSISPKHNLRSCFYFCWLCLVVIVAVDLCRGFALCLHSALNSCRGMLYVYIVMKGI